MKASPHRCRGSAALPPMLLRRLSSSAHLSARRPLPPAALSGSLPAAAGTLGDPVVKALNQVSCCRTSAALLLRAPPSSALFGYQKCLSK
ncbi:hypothetical protein D4764_11G0004640 [Takifugu flavidus]|uniref:Uncharacterized protein n=1 Tax=Takifugu flavidus TaxID=433684 RepID=A0A5C6PFM1_9TELE|nr:hypothetical protein D4764_11G0004640 [Takifugu flavidus]